MSAYVIFAHYTGFNCGDTQVHRPADSLRPKQSGVPERAVDKVAASIQEVGWRVLRST